MPRSRATPHTMTIDVNHSCASAIYGVRFTTREFSVRARSTEVADRAPARGPVSIALQSHGQRPAQLWQFYLQLVEVEAAFKNLKTELAT